MRTETINIHCNYVLLIVTFLVVGQLNLQVRHPVLEITDNSMRSD